MLEMTLRKLLEGVVKFVVVVVVFGVFEELAMGELVLGVLCVLA